MVLTVVRDFERASSATVVSDGKTIVGGNYGE